MKLLIIEGLDRVGKDSLLDEVIKNYKTGFKVHWSFPLGETNEQKTIYQKNSFDTNFEFYAQLADTYQHNNNAILIWNRSHIGELVWGSLYRNSSPEDWVIQLEKFWVFNEDPAVYLVYLYADAEFIAKEDDGKSYSAKLEDKTKELAAFDKAIESSTIKKKLRIKVNNGNEYINHNIILQQVNSFINDEK